MKDLIEIVHPKLATSLELDHPKFLSSDVFADFRKEGHASPDLVAETKTRSGEPQLVLVHVEVEKRYLKTIDERMARYGMHLTLATGKPVVSLVVFLSGGPAGVEVREVRSRVGTFEVWRWRYLAFGLSRSPAEDYVHRPQPLAAALAALMRSSSWDRPDRRLRCLRAISQAKVLDLRQRFLLFRVVDTYVQLTPDEEARFEIAMRRERNKELSEMVVTWDEALAESKEIGQVEAAQQADLRVAERRFGKLPRSFEEKIRRTQDLDRLYLILDRIVEADSIEEVAFD
ncbi:MAG: hypothetical protein AAF560_12170 [Acidobacteriota bacterium]